MLISLREYLDFIRFEKGFGAKVLFSDMLALAAMTRTETNLDKIIGFTETHKIRCTFFFVARRLGRYRKIIGRLVEHGHEICSHGYSHVLYNRLSEVNLIKEFQKADKIFRNHGITVSGFRPPFLIYNQPVERIAAEFGMKYISGLTEGRASPESDIVRVPPVRPYDWYAMRVKRMGFGQLAELWERKKGCYLFHPNYICRHLDWMAKFLQKGHDYRIISNLHPSRISVSFDVY